MKQGKGNEGGRADLKDISKADTKGCGDQWVCAMRKKEESGCLTWNTNEKNTITEDTHKGLLNIIHQHPDVLLFYHLSSKGQLYSVLHHCGCYS